MRSIQNILWDFAKGDSNHRLNYDLNQNSLVFDIGGYKGDFSKEIFGKFGCNIFIFEPVRDFHHKINRRFLYNPKILVFQFGFSDKERECFIKLNGGSSSLHGKGYSQRIVLKNISKFIRESKIKNINLMKINIEGEEYSLLKNLLESGKIKIIQNIQVQFHKNFPDYKAEYKLIKEGLKKTHKLTWRFPFVWESWGLR